MSSLVARFASNIYWLGRYMERAENLARILDINETYARDTIDGPDWARVLRLNADIERFRELHGEATPEAVVHFYLLDRENSSSIVCCTRAARENARSVRHLISTEMWKQLNVFHASVAALQKKDATINRISQISQEVITGCQHFEGVAEGTFLRGEPWCFYQLGKYVERADQTTRILDMGYDRLVPDEDDAIAWVHWNVLLRSVSGYHAYRGRHPGASRPQDIAAFLLYDDEFPRAVALCIERISSRLRDLERRHGSVRVAALEADRRQLEFLVETGPGHKLTSKGLHGYLDRVQQSLGRVSNAIAECYFVGN